ncbi:MAG: hypothetical protein QF662_09205, partial [Phycisphaerae bacterium]|nr:hypothetical protein [Phycisphaerae bacterium]
GPAGLNDGYGLLVGDRQGHKPMMVRGIAGIRVFARLFLHVGMLGAVGSAHEGIARASAP